MHIKVKRGLDIPLGGKPEGSVKLLQPSGEAKVLEPHQLSLNLKSFDMVKFKLLVKVGESVKIGQPLVYDKSCPKRVFISPAAGAVKEVRRGFKRAIVDIVIDRQEEESYQEFPSFDWKGASEEELIDRLLLGGLFAQIRARPFDILAKPDKPPRDIFVKAVESAPFVPPAKLQVAGYEKEFQTGLKALSRLTEGAVHLVYRQDSDCTAFTEASDVVKHTVVGPHPAGTHSLHIHEIAPISSYEEVVWTLDAYDVVAIGFFLEHGKPLLERVISCAGPSMVERQTGYFKVRAGFPIQLLLEGRIVEGVHRFISGDPLMGCKVSVEDFLGFSHFVFCAIPEQISREFLHFFRLGSKKFSVSRAYASGHLDPQKHAFAFTTSQHGEPRAFVDPTLYNRVMPLDISTMTLVRAVLAEDFDLAEALGLLEVASEDFALPTFVCPSKMEMTEIVKNGLRAYAEEVLG